MIEDKKTSQEELSSDETGYLIVPLKTPLQLTGGDITPPPDQQLSFYSLGDNVEETVQIISDAVGFNDDESLTRAAQCGAFWKSVGVETLIYMCSYGGTLIANGLVIRFTNFNSLYSTLLFGASAIMANPNVRIVFNSLLHPPQDTVPENRQVCFNVANKYGFLPVSWFITSTISGSLLTTLNDTNFGTQQAISALSTISAGPIIQGLRSATRSCLKGSIVVSPPTDENMKEVFKVTYSGQPNPNDKGRTHRYGIARDTINRIIAISSGTLVLSLSGGYNIESYCIGGKSELQKILDSGNSTITGDDLSRNCFGGPFTFVLREFGISFAYAVGMMIVEPVLNAVFNKIYDYFYPRQEDTSSSIEIVEITDEDV